MDSQNEQIIRQWAGQVSGLPTVKLFATSDPRSQVLEEFLSELQRLAPGVRVVRDEPGDTTLPFMDVGAGVRYRAVPLDSELTPFLESLAEPAGGGAPPAAEELSLPAHFELYIAPGCPFCPQVAARMARWVRGVAMAQLTIADSILFDDLSAARQIRSVPTLILDEDFRWSTMPAETELVDVMANRDPSRLGAEALEDYLTNGRASALADLMLGQGKIFPAYLELLVSSRWSTRLGAMVAFEYICAANRAMAARVVEPLCRQFDGLAETVQGDVLQILGLTGSRRVTDFLDSVAGGAYGAAVRSAARETLVEMETAEGHG